MLQRRFESSPLVPYLEAKSHLFPLRRMDIRLSSIDYIQMMVNEEDDEESLNEKAEQPKK